MKLLDITREITRGNLTSSEDIPKREGKQTIRYIIILYSNDEYTVTHCYSITLSTCYIYKYSYGWYLVDCEYYSLNLFCSKSIY